MPLVEISTWTLDDAYFADPGIINHGLEFLKNASGCQSVYWGIPEEDKKIFFLFIVWESYEHHKALIDRPGYPHFIGFGPSIDGQASVKHVDFRGDLRPGLSASVTEILLLTMEEGTTEEDLHKSLQILANKVDQITPKYAPAVWGVTLESSREYYAVIGWESLNPDIDPTEKAALMPLIMDVQALAKFQLWHASLKKVQTLPASDL